MRNILSISVCKSAADFKTKPWLCILGVNLFNYQNISTVFSELTSKCNLRMSQGLWAMSLLSSARLRSLWGACSRPRNHTGLPSHCRKPVAAW